MALTLSQLCVNVEKTYQMKLVAGEDGMDNVVRWVHIIEDVEVSHFINGQELVFTTGIAQRGVNWLLPYAEQLLSHGAVGLVINLGPYIEKVPPQLIVWCNSHAFPLLVLPWSVHIIDVTYDFAIASSRVKSMSAALHLHSAPGYSIRKRANPIPGYSSGQAFRMTADTRSCSCISTKGNTSLPIWSGNSCNSGSIGRCTKATFPSVFSGWNRASV